MTHPHSDRDDNQSIAAGMQLAELVLSMDMATEKGLVARRLARQVLGVDDHGTAPALTAVTTNGTTRLIPRDEPVFLVRGQDSVGGEAVRGWALLAEASGARPEILAVARAQAAKMDAWPKKKLADLAGATAATGHEESPGGVSSTNENLTFTNVMLSLMASVFPMLGLSLIVNPNLFKALPLGDPVGHWNNMTLGVLLICSCLVPLVVWQRRESNPNRVC